MSELVWPLIKVVNVQHVLLLCKRMMTEFVMNCNDSLKKLPVILDVIMRAETIVLLWRCLSWQMLRVVPGLITGSSRSGFKLSLLEVKEGLPSVSSNCQTRALPTVTYLEQSFFFNLCMIPGWFSSLPPPATILHPPPLPVFLPFWYSSHF